MEPDSSSQTEPPHSTSDQKFEPSHSNASKNILIAAINAVIHRLDRGIPVSWRPESGWIVRTITAGVMLLASWMILPGHFQFDSSSIKRIGYSGLRTELNGYVA